MPTKKLGSQNFSMRKLLSQDTITVAENLIGYQLTRRIGDQVLSGIITETEAYLGLEDPAAHTYRGKNTERVRPMWADAGTIYVYMIYGIHFCMNITTQQRGVPEAVLIRAIEPLSGLSQMARQYPPHKKPEHYMRGPGCVCKALKIDNSLSGSRLGNEIEISPGTKTLDVRVTERVGIDYAGDAAFWPLRFYAYRNQSVSHHPKQSP